jgi:hypothetical protein
LNADLTAQIPNLPAGQAASITELVKTTAGAAIPSLPENVQAIAGQTFANAVKGVSYVAAFALLIGFLGTFGLKQGEAKKEEDAELNEIETAEIVT